MRRCFGRLDGSIRAFRKVRIRNETDNFIESISQMVPRWSPEVPKTDNFLWPVPKTDNFLRPAVLGYGMMGIPEGYGRYMHQYTYSMHI